MKFEKGCPLQLIKNEINTIPINHTLLKKMSPSSHFYYRPPTQLWGGLYHWYQGCAIFADLCANYCVP